MGKKNGFTIIELGVVILFISLICIGLTPFVKWVREEAKDVKCVNNLQKISLALRAYALEHEEKPPGDLETLFKKGYIGDEKIFDCPFSSQNGDSSSSEYNYKPDFDFTASNDKPMVYDKDPHHTDGLINVLYVNGEIRKQEAI